VLTDAKSQESECPLITMTGGGVTMEDGVDGAPIAYVPAHGRYLRNTVTAASVAARLSGHQLDS
jgi:hypothetical protein